MYFHIFRRSRCESCVYRMIGEINEKKWGKKMIQGLDRINELAKKQREIGLTNAEKVEQQVLREDYLRQIRGQVLDTFSGLTVIDPLGNDVTPDKLRKEQEVSKK